MELMLMHPYLLMALLGGFLLVALVPRTDP
jgi:hypothetical protein